MHTSQGTEESEAELAQAEGETLHFGIERVTCSIWNKEELPQWQEFVTGPVFTTDIPFCV
jgi:hypothetical protein